MKKTAGFTLIEMLVAMAIFSALISVLMLSFQQGMLLWEKSHRQGSYWLGVEFRQGLLDKLVAQAITADNEYKKGLFASHFIGTSKSFELISAAPLMDVVGRVRPIQIQAKLSDDKSWLLRYREGARYSDVDRGINWNSSWVTLFSNLKSVDFLYLAPAFPLPAELDERWLTNDEKLHYRDKEEWLSEYNSQKNWHYPLQIAVNITELEGVAHRWFFTPPMDSDAWSLEVYADN